MTDLGQEIASLFNQMVEAPHDKHELWQQIQTRLNQMRASGMPVPDDLVQLERTLEAEFEADQAPDQAPDTAPDSAGAPDAASKPGA